MPLLPDRCNLIISGKVVLLWKKLLASQREDPVLPGDSFTSRIPADVAALKRHSSLMLRSAAAEKAVR